MGQGQTPVRIVFPFRFPIVYFKLTAADTVLCLPLSFLGVPLAGHPVFVFFLDLRCYLYYNFCLSMTKTCKTCGLAKPPEDFRPGRSGCRKCYALSARKWQLENPEKVRESMRQWKLRNPERILEYQKRRRLKRGLKEQQAARDYRYRNLYGLSSSEVSEMFTACGGVCYACGKSLNRKDVCIDHCHSTGVIRGLVHSRCNLLIGYRERTPEIWRKIDEYMSVFEKPSIP